MLYEVITGVIWKGLMFYATAPGHAFLRNQYILVSLAPLVSLSILACFGILIHVITSYSIHYTKLYEAGTLIQPLDFRGDHKSRGAPSVIPRKEEVAREPAIFERRNLFMVLRA